MTKWAVAISHKTPFLHMGVLLFLLGILLGCGGPVSEEDYSKAFKKECDRYLATAKEIANKPWPKLTGLSKEERRKVLAAKVESDNKVIEGLASDFRKLKPPSSYSGVHTAYQELLDGQVRISKAYASAILANDSPEATKQNQEYEKFLATQTDVLLDQMKKAGGDLGKLSDEWAKTRDK